jgi:hypothetical protein
MTRIADADPALDGDGVIGLIFHGRAAPPPLRSEHLFEDHFVCLLSREHPLAAHPHIALEEYLACSHVVIKRDPCPNRIRDHELLDGLAPPGSTTTPPNNGSATQSAARHPGRRRRPGCTPLRGADLRFAHATGGAPQQRNERCGDTSGGRATTRVAKRPGKRLERRSPSSTARMASSGRASCWWVPQRDSTKTQRTVTDRPCRPSGRVRRPSHARSSAALTVRRRRSRLLLCSGDEHPGAGHECPPKRELEGGARAG